MSCNKVSCKTYILIFSNIDFRAHVERMKALEKGEKVEARCNFEDVPDLVTETAVTAFAVSVSILPFFLYLV